MFNHTHPLPDNEDLVTALDVNLLLRPVFEVFRLDESVATVNLIASADLRVIDQGLGESRSSPGSATSA